MNPTRFLLTLLAAISLLPIAACASKAVYQPLTVVVAEADAIVIARATRVPSRPSLERQSAELTVTQVMKGKRPTGPLTVWLDEAYWHNAEPLKADQQYIVFLRPSAAHPGEEQLMLSGTRLHTEKDAKQIETLLALTPAWSEPQDGLSTTIVPDKYHLAPGEELNLFIGCRNVSDHKITLKYSDWPLATHTFWELAIVPQGGAAVVAEKHPTLTPESINDYFSRFPRTYDVTLEPNQEFFYSIQRVNSAKQGWGYKEELDFKFYPVTAAGAYDITARCKNLRSGTDIVAKGLKIWIE